MASRVFDVDIDANGHQLLNALAQLIAGNPSSPAEGQIWYDSTARKLKYRTNTTNVDPTDRANHTGTQTASTISDLATTVQAYRLDQFAAPNTDLSIGSHKLTNVTDPTSAQDAATKAYVDAFRTGLDVKASVRAASTANVSVTYSATGGTSGRGQITAAPSALDGVSLAANDRILLKDQTTGAQNGLWVVTTLGSGANGVWDRATDADADAEVTAGLFTFVTEGTVNADSGWVLTTNDPITIGGSSGTALVFAQFSGAGQVIAGAGLTKTGNTLDVGAGTGISVAADSVAIDTTLVARYKAFTFGDGAATAFVLNHALANQWVLAQVIRNSSPFDQIEAAVELTDANNITVRTSSVWASNGLKATVVG